MAPTTKVPSPDATVSCNSATFGVRPRVLSNVLSQQRFGKHFLNAFSLMSAQHEQFQVRVCVAAFSEVEGEVKR